MNPEEEDLNSSEEDTPDLEEQESSNTEDDSIDQNEDIDEEHSDEVSLEEGDSTEEDLSSETTGSEEGDESVSEESEEFEEEPLDEETEESTSAEEDESDAEETHENEDLEESSEDEDSEAEEAPPPPEPEVVAKPRDLKVFKTQQWSVAEVVFRSSAKRGEAGFFLAVVMAKALASAQKLCRVEVCHPDPVWEEMEAHVVEEELPLYQIHDLEFNSYDSDTLIYIYDQLDGRTEMDRETLNYWLRAWSGTTTDLFELIQTCESLQVLASLVERGGNPMLAIKL